MTHFRPPFHVQYIYCPYFLNYQHKNWKLEAKKILGTGQGRGDGAVMVRVKLNTTGTVIRLTAVLGSIQPVYQEYITIQIEMQT